MARFYPGHDSNRLTLSLYPTNGLFGWTKLHLTVYGRKVGARVIFQMCNCPYGDFGGDFDDEWVAQRIQESVCIDQQ